MVDAKEVEIQIIREEKETDTKESSNSDRGCMCMLTLHVAVFLLVGIPLAVGSMESDSLPLNFTKICAKKGYSDLDLLLLDKAEESTSTRLILNTSGISYLPAFAFQCNYNFKQNGNIYAFDIHLNEDLELHEHVFIGSNGKKKSNWINERFDIYFYTYGNKLKFGSNTFGKNIFYENIGYSNVQFHISSEEDLDIEFGSKNAVDVVRVRKQADAEDIDSGKILHKVSNWNVKRLYFDYLNTFSYVPTTGN
eukprot:augustus_masked-scaffold_32-processed-gene-0.32-mRNA-1 protein AED:1.00 eAED:1.00 QI:0/-1/0/0/-1/1/1/0/250